MRLFGKYLAMTMAGLAVYVGSFYLLMSPGVPAYDAQDRPVFNNCPRFSESVRVPGPLSIYSGRADFLNYIYYPFDWIYSGSTHQKMTGALLKPEARGD